MKTYCQGCGKEIGATSGFQAWCSPCLNGFQSHGNKIDGGIAQRVINDRASEICRLKEENERCREALEWYANSDNYMFNDTQLATAWSMNYNIEKKARKALRQKGGENDNT